MYKFSLRLTIPSSLNTTELHDVMKDFLIQLYQSSKVIGHSGQENSSNLYLLPVLSPLGEYRHCCSYIFVWWPVEIRICHAQLGGINYPARDRDKDFYLLCKVILDLIIWNLKSQLARILPWLSPCVSLLQAIKIYQQHWIWKKLKGNEFIIETSFSDANHETFVSLYSYFLLDWI